MNNETMNNETMDTPSVVKEFLAVHSTLTLATVNAHGMPQSAPLFFAAQDDGSLVFVSSAKSAHSLNVATTGRAAATVHHETWNWNEIAGVQMEGEVRLIAAGLEREKAWDVYTAKFPFVTEFESEVSRSEFYRFVPTWLRWIDNRVQFGFRQEVAPRPPQPVTSGPGEQGNES